MVTFNPPMLTSNLAHLHRANGILIERFDQIKED
jgi:hypothetical protein